VNADLPTHNDDEELANRFGDFFLGKIETIRDNLKASKESLHSPDVLSADVKFEGFCHYFFKFLRYERQV
jgi:hypothetical protein